MKNLVLVFVLCGLVSLSVQDDKEFLQKMQSAKETCVKETGTDADAASKAMNGEFGDDKNLKCFIKCLFVKLGYMSDDGTVNEEFMKKHPKPGVDAAKHVTIVDKCKSQAGSDVCEKAFNMAKCAHDALKA